MKKANLALAVLLLMGSSAMAQTSGSSAMGSGKMSGGAAGSQPLNRIDSTYLKKDAQGSVYDLATAETGVQKARSQAVMQYATTLIQDHARLNVKLLTLANRRKLTVPVSLDAEGKSRLARLNAANGAAFDRAYLKEAIRINTEDVRDAQKELNATQDPQVRAIVTEFLVTEQKHLARAKELSASMGTSTASTASKM